MQFRFVPEFHEFSKKCIFLKRKCLWRSNSTQNLAISVRSKVSQKEILQNIFLSKKYTFHKEKFPNKFDCIQRHGILNREILQNIEKPSKKCFNKMSLEVQFYTKSCNFGSFKCFTKKFYKIFFSKIIFTQNKMP
jgi:hypothetical protein